MIEEFKNKVSTPPAPTGTPAPAGTTAPAPGKSTTPGPAGKPAPVDNKPGITLSQLRTLLESVTINVRDDN
jgi:hypothetical protein